MMNRNRALENDVKALVRMVGIYCDGRHGASKKSLANSAGAVGRLLSRFPVKLCPDCGSLLKYAVGMRILCPLEPKPQCKKCPSHCYKPEYRAKIREVMKYAGPRLIKTGRVDMVIRHLLGL